MTNLFKEILEKIKIFKVDGLALEIQACLESKSEVEKFEFVKNDKNMYYVIIYIRDMDKNKVHKVFKKLINFIEYNCFSIYEREIFDSVIEYNMVSSNDGVKGYHCKVEFKKLV